MTNYNKQTEIILTEWVALLDSIENLPENLIKDIKELIKTDLIGDSLEVDTVLEKWREMNND